MILQEDQREIAGNDHQPVPVEAGGGLFAGLTAAEILIVESHDVPGNFPDFQLLIPVPLSEFRCIFPCPMLARLQSVS